MINYNIVSTGLTMKNPKTPKPHAVVYFSRFKIFDFQVFKHFMCLCLLIVSVFVVSFVIFDCRIEAESLVCVPFSLEELAHKFDPM